MSVNYYKEGQSENKWTKKQWKTTTNKQLIPSELQSFLCCWNFSHCTPGNLEEAETESDRFYDRQADNKHRYTDTNASKQGPVPSHPNLKWLKHWFKLYYSVQSKIFTGEKEKEKKNTTTTKQPVLLLDRIRHEDGWEADTFLFSSPISVTAKQGWKAGC